MTHGIEAVQTPAFSHPLHGLRVVKESAPFDAYGKMSRLRRSPVRGYTKVTSGTRSFYGLLVNVSADGCLLKTESVLEIGSPVNLAVTVIGTEANRTLRVKGIVRRLASIDGRGGYGIEFTKGLENRVTTIALYASAIASQSSQPSLA